MVRSGRSYRWFTRCVARFRLREFLDVLPRVVRAAGQVVDDEAGVQQLHQLVEDMNRTFTNGSVLATKMEVSLPTVRPPPLIPPPKERSSPVNFANHLADVA